MNILWVFMAIIWIIAELIGYFRKKSFSMRMKSGAIWSVALVSLNTYGGMGPDKISLVYLFSAIFLFTTVAVPVYFFRLKAFNFIKKQSDAEKHIRTIKFIESDKAVTFGFINVITQLFAIAIGYFTGVTLYGLIFATMLARYSVAPI